MSSARRWLESLGFGQFAETFEQNRIDLDVARDLTDQDLRDLGITALGERKLLLRVIATLRNSGPDGASEVQSAPAVPPAQEGERRQLTVLFCDMVG